MSLFSASTPAVEAYPNARPSKREEEEWRRIRARRVAAYLAACDALAAIIVEHAGDLLRHRALIIVACTRRPLTAAAKALIDGEQGLSTALQEALKGIDWLSNAPYLRGHNVGDAPPPEFVPLSAIVESGLSPLRVQAGLPLRPVGAEGKAIMHCPLASECWPSVVSEERMVTHHHAGMSWDRPETVFIPHPVQLAFRAVSELAAELDATDIRGGKH